MNISDVTFLDMETTGFSRTKDNIIQVAAKDIADNGVNLFVDIGFHIPSHITELTGITDSDLTTKGKNEDIVMGELVEYCKKYKMIAGHNCKRFDKPFLDVVLAKHGLALDVPWIDTYILAKMVLPHLTSHKQADVAAYYGYVPTVLHQADADVKTLIFVFKKLIEDAKKQKIKDFSKAIC